MVLLLGDLSHNVVKIITLGIVEDQRQEPPLPLPLQIAGIAGCTNVITYNVVMVLTFWLLLIIARGALCEILHDWEIIHTTRR